MVGVGVGVLVGVGGTSVVGFGTDGVTSKLSVLPSGFEDCPFVPAAIPWVVEGTVGDVTAAAAIGLFTVGGLEPLVAIKIIAARAIIRAANIPARVKIKPRLLLAVTVRPGVGCEVIRGPVEAAVPTVRKL